MYPLVDLQVTNPGCDPSIFLKTSNSSCGSLVMRVFPQMFFALLDICLLTCFVASVMINRRQFFTLFVTSKKLNKFGIFSIMLWWWTSRSKTIQIGFNGMQLDPKGHCLLLLLGSFGGVRMLSFSIMKIGNDWIQGFFDLCGNTTSLHAELFALAHGIKLTWSMGVSHMVCESDSKVALDIINSGVNSCYPCAALVDEVRSFK